MKVVRRSNGNATVPAAQEPAAERSETGLKKGAGRMEKSGWARRLVRHVLLVLAIALPWGGSASAQEWVSILDRSWSADGKVFDLETGEPQSVRCRISSTRPSPHQVTLSGRCATTRGQSRLRFELYSATSGGGARAVVNRLGVEDEVTYSAATGSDVLVLRSRAPFKIASGTYMSEIVLTGQGSDQIDIREVVTAVSGGSGRTLLDISLR